MKVVMARVGVPGPDGRVYSRDVLQEALDAVEEFDGRMLVTLGGGMRMQDVCGQVVEMTLDDDALVAEVETLDTDAGRALGALAQVAQPRIRFSMSGTVKAAADGTVESMTLTGLDASFESKG